MAKISLTVEIDTEDGSMDVSINGKSVPNANSVSCYKYHDSYENEDCVNCNVSAMETDEEAGVAKTTTYYTMSSVEAKRIAKADAKLDIPGFIGQITVDPTEAIAKFLTK